MTTLFILEAVVGFSLLILVHELGHFFAAKWMGIRVEVFSLGFGPCLKKKWGQTEYRLSVIPLGGYVKMAGEEPTPDKPPAPDEFYGKSVGRRAVVLAAGVVMNVVFGFIFLVFAYGVGVPVRPAVVGAVWPGSSAWQEDLRPGDTIVAIDGDESGDLDFSDLLSSVMLAGTDERIRLVIERDGKRLTKVLSPEYNEDLGRKTVGIGLPFTLVVGDPLSEHEKLKTTPGSDEIQPDWDAAFKAGLKPGDLITAVQGHADAEPKPVMTPADVQWAADESNGQPIKIFFVRGPEPRQYAIVAPQATGKRQSLGIRFGSNKVEAVREGAWATEAGLRKDDVVVRVGGKRTRSATEVMAALDSDRDSAVAVTVRRGGREVTLEVRAGSEREPSEDVLAFVGGLAVAHCWPGFPAERAGILPGDEIVSVNGTPVEQVLDLHEAVVKAEGTPLEMAWKRDGKDIARSITPQRRWQVFIPWEPSRKIIKKGFLGACVLGARRSFQWIVRIYGNLKSLLTGDISARHLAGPIAIGYITYEAARSAFGQLLYLLGVVSVNLGVINLLPIPILDGGHLLFALIEKIRGKAVSEKVRAAASYFGLGLLLSVMVLAFWNDISNLLFGFLF